jgi:hypothetical protein
MSRSAIHTKRWVTSLLLLGLVVPVVVVAVSERHFFEVEHRGENELKASLDIALGNVTVGKADDGYLFQAEVVLENEKLVPDFDYRERDGSGHLDVDLTTLKDKEDAVSLPDIGKVKETEWNLYFGDEVPLDLKLELAGTASTMDFTDIPISRLRIEIEASKGSISFDRLNPVEMEYLSIESGASELAITGLINARAERMRFEGGMGKFALDFSGDQPVIPGTIADIEIGMASLDITLPRKGPVILYVPESWFCSVNVPVGYIKHDKGVYRSPDYRTGEDAFTVKVEAGVGKVNFATR